MAVLKTIFLPLQQCLYRTVKVEGEFLGDDIRAGQIRECCVVLMAFFFTPEEKQTWITDLRDGRWD